MLASLTSDCSHERSAAMGELLPPIYVGFKLESSPPRL